MMAVRSRAETRPSAKRSARPLRSPAPSRASSSASAPRVRQRVFSSPPIWAEISPRWRLAIASSVRGEGDFAGAVEREVEGHFARIVAVKLQGGDLEGAGHGAEAGD